MNKKPADSKPRNATLLQSIVHGLPRDATHAGHWDTLTKALRRRRSERDVSLLHLLRDVAQMPGRAWPRCALTHHYLYPPVPPSPPPSPGGQAPKTSRTTLATPPVSSRLTGGYPLVERLHRGARLDGGPSHIAPLLYTRSLAAHVQPRTRVEHHSVRHLCEVRARSGRGHGVVRAWSGRVGRVSEPLCSASASASGSGSGSGSVPVPVPGSGSGSGSGRGQWLAGFGSGYYSLTADYLPALAACPPAHP